MCVCVCVCVCVIAFRRYSLDIVDHIVLCGLYNTGPLYSTILYHKKIRRSNNIESAVVLKYHAIHSSSVDESDCRVIFGAEE